MHNPFAVRTNSRRRARISLKGTRRRPVFPNRSKSEWALQEFKLNLPIMMETDPPHLHIFGFRAT